MGWGTDVDLEWNNNTPRRFGERNGLGRKAARPEIESIQGRVLAPKNFASVQSCVHVPIIDPKSIEAGRRMPELGAPLDWSGSSHLVARVSSLMALGEEGHATNDEWWCVPPPRAKQANNQ